MTSRDGRRRRHHPTAAERVAYYAIITRLERLLRDLERRAGYSERAAAALAAFDREHPRPPEAREPGDHGYLRVIRAALVAQRAVAGDPEAQAQVARVEKILAAGGRR